MQAPAPPLFDHPARQVADHAQALAGEVAGKRRDQRGDEVPQQPCAVAQAAGVFPPVAAAGGDGEGAPDALAAAYEGQNLPAEAVADPEHRQRAGRRRHGIEHGAAVVSAPADHVHLQITQRALARQAHADIVEGHRDKTALGQPLREGGVETLLHAHGRHDQDNAARLAGGVEPVAGEAVSVAVVQLAMEWAGHDELRLTYMVMSARNTGLSST